MSAYPQTWLRASQTIGADVQHLVQGGVHLTRVLVERLVADDADGATETLDYSYRGTDHQIELSARDAMALDRLIAPVIAASRQRKKRPAIRRPLTEVPREVPVAKAVRAWAKDEGIEVSDRGRVAADVVKRYLDAHGG